MFSDQWNLQDNSFVFLLYVVAVDGYLARKLNQISDFGAWVCL